MTWRWLAGALAAGVAACVVSGVAAQTSDDTWLAPQRRSAPASRSPHSSLPPAATSQPSRIGLVSREVIALFDGARETAADRTRIHRFLELPLNHLGLTVSYLDLRNGLPEPEILKRYRGVITWFDADVADTPTWLDWAARAAQSGTRFVVLDRIGAPLTGPTLAKANTFLKPLGLEASDRFIGTGEAGDIVARDERIVGKFEQPIPDERPGFPLIAAKASTVRSHLVVQSAQSRVAPQVRSTVIATGPGGGFAAAGYVRHYNSATQHLGWVLDPFAFLTAALGLEQGPAPDWTTASGRRLYFSHVDGDGWSLPAASGENGEAAAEMVLAQTIAPFPDLPTTVGIAEMDVAVGLGAPERAADTARRLLALPHVEAAAQSASRPLRWSYFESYDRTRELAQLIARRATMVRTMPRSSATPALLVAADRAVRFSRSYAAVGPGMPRALMLQAFDLNREINGAVDVVRALAPASKPAPIYLWSGDARPFEAAVAATRTAGVRNLNGGDGRLDAEVPSIMYLPPLARPVGHERQIYAPTSSENAFTASWQRDFGGQARLAETWERTDSPRRLSPVELHYHMYSGTRPESLAALKGLLSHARADRLAPVTTSQYAAIADSFADIEITRMGPSRWRVANRGALHTVRFDDAAGLHVDLRQANGVLGFTHHGDALYVALDEAVPSAVVAITQTPPDPRRPDRPYLVESRWLVSNLKLTSCGFEATVRGFGPLEATWAGLRPGAYSVAVTADDSEVEAATEAVADAAGELHMSLKADGIGGARLKAECTRTSTIYTGSVRR